MIRLYKTLTSTVRKGDAPQSLIFVVGALMVGKYLSKNYYVFFVLFLGVTALIITATYQKQEFIRVGYYVHNQVQENLPQDPLQMPLEALLPKIRRTIISDKPRVTKFNIDWTYHPSKKELISGRQTRLEDFGWFK